MKQIATGNYLETKYKLEVLEEVRKIVGECTYTETELVMEQGGPIYSPVKKISIQRLNKKINDMISKYRK